VEVATRQLTDELLVVRKVRLEPASDYEHRNLAGTRLPKRYRSRLCMSAAGPSVIYQHDMGALRKLIGTWEMCRINIPEVAESWPPLRETTSSPGAWLATKLCNGCSPDLAGNDGTMAQCVTGTRAIAPAHAACSRSAMISAEFHLPQSGGSLRPAREQRGGHQTLPHVRSAACLKDVRGNLWPGQPVRPGLEQRDERGPFLD
jgi:hypothetical protein